MRKQALISPFCTVEFARAVHDLKDLPSDCAAEVAFAGRSNAGKSSAINALTNRSRAAHVSKTPGRTRAINFFGLGADRYLVDLPGYGYAAVPKEERRNWGRLISTYIQERAPLRGIMLVMDARHAFTPLDRQMLDWITPLQKPTHVLLTKSDKMTRNEALRVLHAARIEAKPYSECTLQLFSSATGTGVEAARAVLVKWLQYK